MRQHWQLGGNNNVAVIAIRQQWQLGINHMKQQPQWDSDDNEAARAAIGREGNEEEAATQQGKGQSRDSNQAGIGARQKQG